MDAKTYAMFKNVSSRGSRGASGYDELSGGNITEIDGKKVLTPLGAGKIYSEVSTSFDVTVDTTDEPTFIDAPFDGALSEGSKYIVTVDGTSEEYTASVYDGFVYIGKWVEDLEYGDWCILSEDDYTGVVVFGANVGDIFSFEIEGRTETIHTINNKFLPENEYINCPFQIIFNGEEYRLFDKYNNDVTNGQFIEYLDKNNNNNIFLSTNSTLFNFIFGKNFVLIPVYKKDSDDNWVVGFIVEAIEIWPFDSDPNDPVIPIVTRYENNDFIFRSV